MTEIKIVKDRAEWRRYGWSATPNRLLLDSTISWDAKGAFGWLSLAADDPEFDVTANSLAAAGPRGRDHAQRMLRELEEHGWLTRRRVVGESGVPEIVYELHPVPVPPEERTYRPSTAKPRKGAFSQVKAENRNVQASGAEQGTVDNSSPGQPARDGQPEQIDGVSAGQRRKPERVGPERVGPARSGGLTTSPERRLPPPTSSTDGQPSPVEAEEEEEAPISEDHAAAVELVRGLRFRSGRYLKRDARQAVVEVVAQQLRAGWPREHLARRLAEWAAQALNPSTYLLDQLDQLGAPPQRRRAVVVEDRPDTAPPASEATRRQVMALVPRSRPREPRWGAVAARSGPREPRRALADLDALLGVQRQA